MTSQKTFGIGAWKMRNGEKAVVTHIYYGAKEFPLRDESGDAWQVNGRYSDDRHECDLISPWTEETTPMGASDVLPDRLTQEQPSVVGGGCGNRTNTAGAEAPTNSQHAELMEMQAMQLKAMAALIKATSATLFYTTQSTSAIQTTYSLEDQATNFVTYADAILKKHKERDGK